MWPTPSEHGWHSKQPIDKVCAIASPFQRHGALNYKNMIFLTYGPFSNLRPSITSTKMEASDLGESAPKDKNAHLGCTNLTLEAYLATHKTRNYTVGTGVLSL